MSKRQDAVGMQGPREALLRSSEDHGAPETNPGFRPGLLKDGPLGLREGRPLGGRYTGGG